MTWLGLDIGGANLKAADGRGWARQLPFALWRDPDGLATALAGLVDAAPEWQRVAITMTGELCDCYLTRANGVGQILAAVEHVAGGRPVCVYFLDGRLASVDEARERSQLAAASNWHALAQYTCRFAARKSALMIDIGSTTTDIITISDGRVCPRGLSDTERLLSGELIYTGLLRTPICALTPVLPYLGKQCPVAAELFATTADAYVLLSEIEQDFDATWTADGQPLTIENSRRRLARMLCDDGTVLENGEIQEMAEAVRSMQLRQIELAVAHAIDNLPGMPEVFVTAGAGEFLVAALLKEKFSKARRISLMAELGKEVSVCAPAHALAVLAREAEGE